MILRNQDVIWVVPNKWTHLDETGLPQGVVLRDFREDGTGWIGARRDTKTGKFTYTDEPVKVRATRYTRDRIVRGELFLASPEAAPALGINYVEPWQLMLDAKKAAIAAFDAQHGKGEWLRINEPLPPLVGDLPKPSFAGIEVPDTNAKLTFTGVEAPDGKVNYVQTTPAKSGKGSHKSSTPTE